MSTMSSTSTTLRPLLHEDPSPQTQAQFSPFPWTKSYFDSSEYTPIANNSRKSRPPPSTQESLMSRTLITSDTVLAWQNFHAEATSERPYGQVISLVNLGTGLNGHEDVAHGGFVGVLLDEVIGMACEYLRDRRVLTMTAYLNISFKKPVPTPGALLLRGWVEKKEGRKIWGKGTVEDGNGNVLSTGDALFIILKEQL